MSARPRNEDLPILAELGDDLAAGFRRQERAEAARRNRRRLRRVAMATGALFVIVPGAVATKYIWAPDPSLPAKSALESSRAVQIADGRGEAAGWRLSASFTEGDGLCWQLTAFSGDRTHGRAASCDLATRGQAVGYAFMLAGAETVVFGGVQPGVARVRVDPGNGQPAKDARLIVAPADRARKAGLPAGARAYVATFLADFSDGRAVVTAFDASGREVGRVPPKR